MAFIFKTKRSTRFEGQIKEQYSANSGGKAVSNTAKKAGIRIPVSAHILSYSFTTHLLKSGINIKYISTVARA